jgi:hypothetical protein
MRNLLFFLLSASFLYSQERFTISGTVTAKNTKETLFGVNVVISNLKIGATTNEYGYYVFNAPKGKHTITVSYLGYKTLEQTIEVSQNTRLNFSLEEEDQLLQEVVVTDRKNKAEIQKPEMSVNKLSMQEVKRLPVLLGEVDILKTILNLPGVTNAGEGQSGFNVRGGGADQNLILLDEATIYNSSHLFGLFSVFNGDAVKDLKLYKGGIPAKYGGRLSSVLDIYQKEGNKQKFEMNGGIGVISSRLLAEGPVVKDKSSFLIAGRGTYAHLFLKFTDINNTAYFYDLNTKWNYEINQNNTLYLSGYFGRDVFSLSDRFVNTYGNATLNLRWNHLFSEKLFSNLSLIYSDYYYGLQLGFVGFDWQSGILNYQLKYDLKQYISDNIKLSYGANMLYYDFNPGRIVPIDASSSINESQLEKKFAFEPAVYFDVEQKLSEKWAVQYGLRYSQFYRLGTENIFNYANNQPVIFNPEIQIYEKAPIIGSTFYGSNQKISAFDNLEPRFAVSYAWNDNQSVKASYNRMAQYLHLISNTQSPTPLDVWTPSGPYLKPQRLDQYAIGYFQNLKEDQYTLEIESFFKRIYDRVDYIDGADLVANNAIEQVVLNGEGRAYGLEFLLRKNTGKWNGWLAYTLSRSEQRTPGRTPIETGINNGAWYRANWDKLHNISVTANYDLNKKWRFGAVFALQSGQPITLPNGSYEYQGITVPTYGLRNQNSLPTFHRLDISANYTPKPDKKQGWQGEWVFGIYNIYNRMNAASLTFRQNQDSGQNEAVRLSIFGIVPSVTYNFKF